MKKTVLTIMMIVLPVYILLTIVQVHTFNKNIYSNSFIKHNISQTSGKTLDELEDITEIILEYLKDDVDGHALEPYFNKKEIYHMEDVKGLFIWGFKLKGICLFIILLCIIVIGLKGYWNSFYSALFYGIFPWWGLFLLLFILSMKDFNRYFTYFHLIFFDNDLWILNPKTDLLIQMLPEEFFISIFIRIVLFFLLLLAIIQTIGYILMKKGRSYNGKVIEF